MIGREKAGGPNMQLDDPNREPDLKPPENTAARPARVRFVQVQKVEKGSARLESDLLAVEEPLEILLGYDSQGKALGEDPFHHHAHAGARP